MQPLINQMIRQLEMASRFLIGLTLGNTIRTNRSIAIAVSVKVEMEIDIP